MTKFILPVGLIVSSGLMFFLIDVKFGVVATSIALFVSGFGTAVFSSQYY